MSLARKLRTRPDLQIKNAHTEPSLAPKSCLSARVHSRFGLHGGLKEPDNAILYAILDEV